MVDFLVILRVASITAQKMPESHIAIAKAAKFRSQPSTVPATAVSLISPPPKLPGLNRLTSTRTLLTLKKPAALSPKSIPFSIHSFQIPSTPYNNIHLPLMCRVFASSHAIFSKIIVKRKIIRTT